MARFALWRFRSTVERVRLIVAGGAAVVAALTLVLLVVEPNGSRVGEAGRPVAAGVSTSAVSATGVEIAATAVRPTRTAKPTPRPSVRPSATLPARPTSARATPRSAGPTASYAVTLEAEAASLGGAARRISCSCSGGAVIGQLGSGFTADFHWSSGWLTFNGINPPAAGDYTVTVRYRSSRDLSLRISVNGAGSDPVRCRAGSAGSVTTTARLTAGRNSIRLFNDFGAAPDIDKITIGGTG